MTLTLHRIRNADPADRDSFWSNTFGWVEQGYDLFTESEKQACYLPIDGEWEPADPDAVWNLLTRTYQDARDGQAAVEKLCAEIGLTARAHCEPCESDTPTHDGACAVCGTSR